MNDDDQPSGPPMAQQVPETFTQSDSLELQNLNNGEGQARKALYDQDIDQNAYNDLMGQIQQRRSPLQARQQQAQSQAQQQQLQQAMHGNAMQQAMQHSDGVFRAKGFNDRVTVYTDPLTGKRAHVAEMKPGHFEQLDMGDEGGEEGSTGNAASSGGPGGPPAQNPQDQQITIQNGKVTPYTTPETAAPGTVPDWNPGQQQAEKVYVDPSKVGPNGVTQVNMPQAAQSQQPHDAELLELAKEGRKIATALGLKGPALEHAASLYTDHLIKQHAQNKQMEHGKALASEEAQRKEQVAAQQKQEKEKAATEAAKSKAADAHAKEADRIYHQHMETMRKEETEQKKAAAGAITPEQKDAADAMKKPYHGDPEAMHKEAIGRTKKQMSAVDEIMGINRQAAAKGAGNTSKGQESSGQQGNPLEALHAELPKNEQGAPDLERASESQLQTLGGLLADHNKIGMSEEKAKALTDHLRNILEKRKKLVTPPSPEVPGSSRPLMPPAGSRRVIGG